MSITETLLAVSDGGAMEDLGSEIRSVVNAVVMTGKKGSVTLKLDIMPNGPDAVKVSDKVTSVMPASTPQETTFYVTDECGLTRMNPRQPVMDLDEEEVNS